MVSIYSLPSHTLHIRCPIPVVQRTANQITSLIRQKKAKRYPLLPYHPPRITQYLEILVPEATDSKEVTDHQKLSFRTIFPDFHSVRRKVTFRMSDMITSDINMLSVLQLIFCHMPFSYMSSLVACFFQYFRKKPDTRLQSCPVGISPKH